MCPPHASSRDPFTGRHIGRPLQSRLQYPSAPEERAGTEPRPYRSIVVRSSGPMYLRHGFRRPNFVPKFGASVMGIGPYAPRGDEGRHAGSSCPTGGCGEPPRLPWVAAHSGASAPAGAREWVEIGAEIIPKVSSNLGQSLSQPAADSSLYTREPWGRGMRIAASALQDSSQ